MFTLVMLYTTMINYDGPVAPYRQVAAILRERIAAGTYRAGFRLPSVADLVGEFGVARTTANKALRLLAAEGLAELSEGMGYYVVEPGASSSSGSASTAR